MRTLEDYRRIIGNDAVGEIHNAARRLRGKHVVHINATYQGGGVAEMLETLVPLMNDVGLEAGWRIIPGPHEYFKVTKAFHNALQGADIDLNDLKKHIYKTTNEAFSVFTHFKHDIVFIHDPQPAALIKYYARRQPWIWRCHIDLSSPNEELWEFLEQFIVAYDEVVVSHERYRQPALPQEQVIFHPAIDPLSTKNMDLPDHTIEEHIGRAGIPTDKPFILQISRFDPWKNQPGLIDAFKIVREEVPCRLVLCGGMAADDPEGVEIYTKVRDSAHDLLESGDLILMTDASTVMVNSLQRSAAVVVQNSIKEGFGLTVTEAMWKGTPVVATNVGGIPLQITDRENGLLCEANNAGQLADRILRVLNDPELGEEMGRRAKETVRERFLITRLLKQDLDLFCHLLECSPYSARELAMMGV